MRNLVLLVIFGFGTILFANKPAVGDKITYQVKSKYGEFNELSFELTSFNSVDKKFTLTKTKFLNGTKISEEQFQVNDSDIPTSSSIRILLKNCKKNNGIIETIKVIAGTFETCKVNMDEGDIYFGDVPISGTVKGPIEESGSYMELQSIQYGKSRK